MRKDVLVYLSGPITSKHGHSSEENVAAAVNVFLALLAQGIPCFCPHLSAAFPSAWGLSYDAWMAYDYAIIDRCTHVMMLPRWQESAGAMLEREYAIANGKPVVEYGQFVELDALGIVRVE